MKLNAVEVLYMHFVDGRTHDEAILYDFWLTRYSSHAEDLIESLLDKDIIYVNDDLSVTLQKLKVPDLKRLLRHSGIKVSGNKNVLIERIINNQHILDLKGMDLKSVYTINKHYKPFVERTDFINFFHFNGHISIDEAYDYYLVHPDKTSDAIVTGFLKERIEEHINNPNKYDVLKSFLLLSNFYLDKMNDLDRSIYCLNNFTMLIILQSITNYHSDRTTMAGNHFNIDNYTAEKYRNLLNSGRTTPHYLYIKLINDTDNLPYPYEHRKLAARCIVDYVMEENDAEVRLRNLLDDNKE